MTTVALIDSGGANIASLEFALARLGAASVFTRDPAVIESASHVIVPGVGAAADAMSRLEDYGLIETIRRLDQPVLGICLGMQLLCRHSEEDDVDCIGVFPEQASRLPASREFPVPNMGWCAIHDRKDHALLDGIPDGAWFYFVHSYALPPSVRAIACADHREPFAAIMAQDNFFATQFHPERSAEAGARLLANFLEMKP